MTGRCGPPAPQRGAASRRGCLTGVPHGAEGGGTGLIARCWRRSGSSPPPQRPGQPPSGREQRRGVAGGSAAAFLPSLPCEEELGLFIKIPRVVKVWGSLKIREAGAGFNLSLRVPLSVSLWRLSLRGPLGRSGCRAQERCWERASHSRGGQQHTPAPDGELGKPLSCWHLAESSFDLLQWKPSLRLRSI